MNNISSNVMLFYSLTSFINVAYRCIKSVLWNRILWKLSITQKLILLLKIQFIIFTDNYFIRGRTFTFSLSLVCHWRLIRLWGGNGRETFNLPASRRACNRKCNWMLGRDKTASSSFASNNKKSRKGRETEESAL